MHTQQQVRDLLGPADPARGVVVPAPPLSAHDLILRAENSAPPTALPSSRRHASRRTLLVGAAVAATAAASAGLVPVLRRDPAPTGPTPQAGGIVLQPVGYEIATDGEPAGPHLRALAGHLTDASYDRAGGRYAYQRIKSWGGVIQMSPEGHMASFVDERRSWTTPDGRRWSDTTVLDVEYPDAASRDYWTRQFSARPTARSTRPPAGPREEPRDLAGGRRLPTGRAALARLLRADQAAGDVAMAVYGVYTEHLVPRRTRADILTILAGIPGFVWRGRVVDRAGRPGLGVTADLIPPTGQPQRAQMLLVFDPSTGELLAHEYLELAPRHRVLHYGLLLEGRRTDTIG